jgi:A/G-specific adenine glycosylase
MTLAGQRARAKQAKPVSRPKPRAGAAPDAAALLAWYDRHRRALPWRALPGQVSDPYRVWLSEIMLQQTTVKTVAPYFAKFTARWPTVAALAAAPLDDVLKLWAGLGYYARARNLHACAKAIVERHGGRFPENEADLSALPGIGGYTAAAIAAIAFGARAAAVDGNVERVVSRLFAVEDELPAGKPRIRLLAAGLVPEKRTGDFAQAMMDLGATLCTPKKPACGICPWMAVCVARRRGDPERFPRKAPKQAGRLRRGAAFVLVRADGQVLVRTRPSTGLLGGMTEVPTTEWTHDFDERSALKAAPRLGPSRQSARKRGGGGTRRRRVEGEEEIQWRRVPGIVTHVFTHFPLELVVYTAEVPASACAPEGARWVPMSDLAGEALPNLMRKVLAHPSSVARNAPRRRREAVSPQSFLP